ncbi:hypothetical protein [Streptomyces sp. NPDC001536]|uniref:ATP-dependent DNA ligase n=1 Tax=Streptomyces sp. NPDC001536 TaxID=3364583 RepID=UPI0036A8F6FA
MTGRVGRPAGGLSPPRAAGIPEIAHLRGVESPSRSPCPQDSGSRQGAVAGRWADGRIALRSRNGSDLSRAFPEIEEAVRRLPDDTTVDCEPIVREAGRLAFERLQQHMHRRGASAARAAVEFPAQLVAFDLLRVRGRDLTGRPSVNGTARWRRCSSRRVWRRRGRRARARPMRSRRPAGWPTTRPSASWGWCSGPWRAGCTGRPRVDQVQGAAGHGGDRGCGHGQSAGAHDGVVGPLRRGRCGTSRKSPAAASTSPRSRSSQVPSLCIGLCVVVVSPTSRRRRASVAPIPGIRPPPASDTGRRRLR